jgi:hypothetical protein
MWPVARAGKGRAIADTTFEPRVSGVIDHSLSSQVTPGLMSRGEMGGEACRDGTKKVPGIFPEAAVAWRLLLK